MINEQKTISILVPILVFKLHCALGFDIRSTNGANNDNRIIQPSGFEYTQVLHQQPQIVYFSDQTTRKTDLKWLATTPHTIRAARTTTSTHSPPPPPPPRTTAAPKSYPPNQLRKAASVEVDNSGASTSDESNSFFDSESEETLLKKLEKKRKKKQETTSTTTPRPRLIPVIPIPRFPQSVVFNRFPCNLSPALRNPAVLAHVNNVHEPAAAPSTPQHQPNRPIGFILPPSFYRPRPAPSSPAHNQPLTGLFRVPTYRTFYVMSRPKEPPPQPPLQHHPSNKKHGTDTTKDTKDESSEKKEKEKKHKEHSSEEQNYSRESETKYGDDESGEEGDGKQDKKDKGYKVYESHEEGNHKKYNDKDGSKTGGKKHGHEASEKKDEGGHASGESGFNKEEGHVYNVENKKRTGFHTDHGYNNHNHYGKGNKGAYDEKKESDFHGKNHDNKASKHGGAKGYAGKEHSYHDDKGGKFNEQKLHKTGAKTLGYHNIFQKDEFKKVHTYYDNGDHQGKHFEFGDEHEQYDKKKGSADDDGKHGAGHKKASGSKYGQLQAQGNSDNESWNSKYVNGKDHSEDGAYETKNGHKGKNQKGARWK